MRYADARMAESERSEIYRVYVAKCLQSALGINLGYYELAHGAVPDEFDAEQVVDGVIAKMGLEEVGE